VAQPTIHVFKAQGPQTCSPIPSRTATASTVHVRPPFQNTRLRSAPVSGPHSVQRRRQNRIHSSSRRHAVLLQSPAPIRCSDGAKTGSVHWAAATPFCSGRRPAAMLFCSDSQPASMLFCAGHQPAARQHQPRLSLLSAMPHLL
jgi:hypothetical protein